MKKFSSQEIREIWLRFFKDHGHSVEPSAPLVPRDDKTLLWINAGVAPLKKYFDGSSRPQNPRITNLQKCIRTNDIENVGRTARHHTFFEMMGNFSIGDYFKDEVIPWALELLTSPTYFGIPQKLLFITVYDQDKYTYDKWVSLGIEESHLIKMDSNFWEIGPGPSGPCTEIFFDRGESYDSRGIELIAQDLENDRYHEIWNIVFSQYNAKEGVSRSEYQELPSKNIDTGAGLERFACVLQGVKTNYDTDLFMPIINKISEISGVSYEGQMAFKVIADHVRTVTFALSDGAVFANEGRGYVLRRVLRRAVKYAKKLGINRPFMDELVDTVLEIMGEFYPYLYTNIQIIKKMITTEEEKFLSTILKGEQKLEDLLKNNEVISGSDAFLLYDTYGFPIELTEEYALEVGKTVDLEGFKTAMDEQKNRARNARKNITSFGNQNQTFLDFKEKSNFIGYNSLSCTSKVVKIFDNAVVVEETPFYAFSGGQLSDLGTMDGIEVNDVIKMPNGQHLHFVSEMIFSEGQIVNLVVDKVNREEVMANHSSAHLTQSALKTVLGSHVSQQGSQVSSDSCRFDFNNFNALTDEQIIEVEDLVNQYIEGNHGVETVEMSINEAKESGATALFGEKYGSSVRVVDMQVSKELCAGTHVSNTKEIQKFGIVSIESIGSGTYRITAVTKGNINDKIDKHIDTLLKEIKVLCDKKTSLVAQIENQGNESKLVFETVLDGSEIGYRYVLQVKREIANLKDYLKLLSKELNDLMSKNALKDLNKFDDFIVGNTLITKVVGFDGNQTKELTDALLNKLGTGIVFIASVLEDKIIFVCKNNINLDSGLLVKKAAQLTGGNGGGRKDMASAGGKDTTKVDDAIALIKGEVNE